MKKLALVLAFAATVATAGAVRAEIGTADPAPAATLLLPYFEVDLSDPSAATPTFTINNASATALLTRVTLWTDEGIPTYGFGIYLTGYDVQQVNLRTIFETGGLPITADTDQDPLDTISPSGDLAQDINFAGAPAPCGALYTTPALSQAELRHIRASHTGKRSAILGGCAGATYGDNVARGYVTVDTVSACSTLSPASAGYFSGVATDQNVLWGDYTVTNAAQNFEWGGSLVHVESCGGPLAVGGGTLCPLAAGDYTFYGRLVDFDASDKREPLATTFAARYRNGGIDSASTEMLIWRDTKRAPTGANGKHNCSKKPAWFPLAQSDVVAFDEQENPSNLCFLPDNVSPPIGGQQTCFPLAAQRAEVFAGTELGFPLQTPFDAGWLYLNLNHALSGSDPQPGVAQAWVEIERSSEGRFAVGHGAIALDNALATQPGGILLIP